MTTQKQWASLGPNCTLVMLLSTKTARASWRIADSRTGAKKCVSWKQLCREYLYILGNNEVHKDD